MSDERERLRAWVAGATRSFDMAHKAEVICEKQGWGELRYSSSINDNALCLNGQVYERGLGAHAYSEILVKLPAPGRSFHAFVGLDDNKRTQETLTPAHLEFSVAVNDVDLWTSMPLTRGDAPGEVSVKLGGAREFRLIAREINDKLGLAHADWADARVTLEDGTELWLSKSFAERRVPDGPPISFTYGGESSRALLPRWQRTYDTAPAAHDGTLHRVTYQDPDTGLQCVVEMTEFADFPAAEWVVRFKNTGLQDTPILENVQALDYVWPSLAEEVVLHRSKGALAQFDDFYYSQEILFRQEVERQSEGVRMAPLTGKSSNSWLPFFNIQTGSEGFITALGWTGEWAAEFSCANSPDVVARAGMDKTHLKLLPGEEIRTPRILMLFWQGEVLTGNNTLRQFILKHHTPQRDGKPAVPPVSSLTWGGMKTASHLYRIEQYHKHGLEFDVYWIDAGWYGIDETDCPDVFTGDWAMQVGNWNINKYRHPNGLRPVSDAAHKAGMKFLLWIEPERAVAGTRTPLEHPDWFLGNPHNHGDPHGGSALQLNLGHPEALHWAIHMVSNYITELDLDWYRQDSNVGDMLTLWRAADAPDRQGISEIRHVEGLYAFWDELRARHPNLMIDNCASGGRRLDLETISRSITLWRSDYQCAPKVSADAAQVQLSGLLPWLPAHTVGNLWQPPGDTYQYRSSMSAGISDQIFICEVDTPGEDYPWEWHRQRITEQKRIQPAFYGDFYPLTPCSVSPENWMAYSMHHPGLEEGFVMAFRRDKSPFSRASFLLPGVNPRASYLFEDADTGAAWTEQGENLVEKGLSVEIDNRRESKLIYYRAAG